MTTDPRVLIERINTALEKPYTIPQVGDVWVAVRDQGGRILTALVTAVEQHGRGWAAVLGGVEPLGQNWQVRSGDVWRRPEEWHPRDHTDYPDRDRALMEKPLDVAAAETARRFSSPTPERVVETTGNMSDTVVPTLAAVKPPEKDPMPPRIREIPPPAVEPEKAAPPVVEPAKTPEQPAAAPTTSAGEKEPPKESAAAKRRRLQEEAAGKVA